MDSLWKRDNVSTHYDEDLGYVIKEEPLFGPVELPFYDEGEEEEDLRNALSLRSEEMDKLIQREDKKRKARNPLSLSKGKRYKFLFINLISLLVSEATRGMTVATLVLYVHSYGADESFYAIVTSAFSVGRFIGGFFLGWVFNKRGAKTALALSILISLCGNALYSFGINKYVILSARVIVGVGTGVLTIVRACIAAATTKEERSGFISLSAASAFFGFAVTPGVSFLLTHIDIYITKGYYVNQFTSAGWILVIANLIVLILVLIEPVNVKPVAIDNSGPKEKIPRSLYLIVWSYVFLNFAARGAISLIETVGAPMFLQIWEGPHFSNTRPSSLMFLIAGTIGLVIFIVIPYIKKIPENILTGIGFLFITAGSLVLIQFSHTPVGLTQFLVGMGLLWSIGSPITQVVIITAFSKALGARPQGVWMGLMQAGGAVGRIVFPLFASVCTYNIDFLICAGVAFISAVLAIVLRFVKIQAA